MKRKVKSFILSLLIHFVLAVSIFFLYKTLSASTEKQHLCTCCSTTINLNTIQTVKTETAPVKEKIEKPIIKKTEKQLLNQTAEKVQNKELFTENEVVIQQEVQTKEIKSINNIQEVVQVDQNLTQSVENTKVKKDVDTHCKTEVVVSQEPQKQEDSYLSLHVGEIVSLLKDNLYYPRRARRQGIEGVVRVQFTLSKEAEISNIEIVESKHEILSHAAIETIENLEEKLPKPDEELILTIPINYDLQ